MPKTSSDGRRTRHFAKVTAGVLIRRPGLAPEAVRAMLALRSDKASRVRYLEWRAITAYGNPDHRISRTEMADFLEWRRRLRRSR